MIKSHLLMQITTFLLLISNFSFAVVGGEIIEDSRVARLSKCENQISHRTGGSLGCSDYRLATGSFISSHEILTAGHFAAHFKFNSQGHFLKVIVNKQEAILKYNEDFIVRIAKSYNDYEKRIRKNPSLAAPSIETCGFDIAVITLTQSGVRKLDIQKTFDVEIKKPSYYGLSVEMYGYGNHVFEIYNEQQANLTSTLNWILTLGESDRKTWIKDKESDDKLRLGSNILRPSCETMPDDNPKHTIDTIESIMGDNTYYNSYMASGDSGGPAIMNGKIVGVFCSITSFHNGDEIRFVNLITPTYSDSLKEFWSDKQFNY